MLKVFLISNDGGLISFCNRLCKNYFDVTSFSPSTGELGDVKNQASVILLDFELIINGNNDIVDSLQLDECTLIPLVREARMSTALKLLACNFEEIILLPCCIEYLQAQLLKFCVQDEIITNTPLEREVLASLIGSSREMISFKKKLLSVAKNDLSVLIIGETGTGKSFIARLIHMLSSRSEKKFVEENVAAIQETLVEGELFGTKVGAYTGAVSRIGLFEYAHNGTLFLDEIACIKNTIQTKLLQVLETGVFRPVGSVEEKKSNVRLISATNISLDLLKNHAIFRDDLYYRISGVQLVIPPLRSRKDDICLLAKYFLGKVASKTGIQKMLTKEAVLKLESHNWPGNVRELERCVECAYFMTSESVITGSDICFVS